MLEDISRKPILDRLSLKGRVIVVTGASRGIGSGLAQSFAEAGADLVLVARDEQRLAEVAVGVRANGRQALAVVADVSDLSTHSRIVEEALEKYGQIDVLANVAGITRRQSIVDVTPADWDYVLNTNLRAVYFLTQAVGREMIKQRRGKIINLASMNSYRGFADVSVYGLGKAAVSHLTMSLAVEWAPHNIQANAIAPGWIDTPMTSTMNPERRRWVEDHLPVGQFGTPDDLAGLAVYLASEASDYTTGQVFAVDGGFLAGNPWTPNRPQK